MASDSSGHVVDEVADFVRGALSRERRVEIANHLAGCADCAGDFALAERLLPPDAASSGVHPDGERLVALSEGTSALAPGESAHLAGCVACQEELTWLRTVLEPPEERAAVAAPETGRWSTGLRAYLGRRVAGWHRFWPALVPAAAVLAFLLIRGPLAPGVNPERLAEIAPMVVRIERGWSNADEFSRTYTRALTRYRNADYAGALAELVRATALRPDHPEARLYLGSTRLLLHQYPQAIDDLRQARDMARSGPQETEAAWQLATALMAGGGDRRELRQLLSEIAQGTSGHQRPAQHLLSRLHLPAER